MTYQEVLKAHLADYKRVHLGISQPGIFKFRGREVRHDHILPAEHASKNLLEEAQPTAFEFFKNFPEKRHKDFHHLNSSQAFAFNLFFPFFEASDTISSSLLRALGQDARLLNWR